MENKNDSDNVVSQFDHERALWHANMFNQRMFISLIAVCITFVITIMIFVNAHTIREKQWLDALTSLRPQTEVNGCADQQPNP